MVLDDIDILIFDFDGVLTNNLVYVDQTGSESVSCSRADGLAFDVLRIMQKPAYIISTERNSVVTARAKKLNIPVIQGAKNKLKTLNQLAEEKQFNLQNVLFVGNDLNDYQAMQACGYAACPNDSHEKIKLISSVVLNTKGGYGVVRELLEEVFHVDIVKILNID